MSTTRGGRAVAIWGTMIDGWVYDAKDALCGMRDACLRDITRSFVSAVAIRAGGTRARYT